MRLNRAGLGLLAFGERVSLSSGAPFVPPLNPSWPSSTVESSPNTRQTQTQTLLGSSINSTPQVSDSTTYEAATSTGYVIPGSTPVVGSFSVPYVVTPTTISIQSTFVTLPVSTSSSIISVSPASSISPISENPSTFNTAQTLSASTTSDGIQLTLATPSTFSLSSTAIAQSVSSTQSVPTLSVTYTSLVPSASSTLGTPAAQSSPITLNNTSTYSNPPTPTVVGSSVFTTLTMPTTSTISSTPVTQTTPLTFGTSTFPSISSTFATVPTSLSQPTFWAPSATSTEQATSSLLPLSALSIPATTSQTSPLPTISVDSTTSALSTPVTSSSSTNSYTTSNSQSPTTTSSSSSPSASGFLSLNFVNNMKTGPVYAYLTGNDCNGQLVMLNQDGQFYYPSTTSGSPVPIPSTANVALLLGGNKQTTKITLPDYITSARLWVSHGRPLQFGITNGGLVEPSAVNDDDPNHNTNWGFIEFTYNNPDDGGLYANLSFVDFIGLPLGMLVSGSGNSTQSALGPHKYAKEHVCRHLQEQSTKDGQPWNQLCKLDDQGNLVRVVSPQTLVTQNSTAFASYFDDYVEAVWQQFAETPLVIQTQSSAGTINCTTSGEELVCEGDDTPFTKPSSGDIFGCASGPFANAGNAVHLAAVPRVCAAFNRATLHLPGGNIQPDLPPSHYYDPPATNFYSRFVHETEIDGKGYAFSYDDVSPDQSVYNTAGLVAMPDPSDMTIYIGGYEGGA